jgi:chromosome segregation ATPase
MTNNKDFNNFFTQFLLQRVVLISSRTKILSDLQTHKAQYAALAARISEIEAELVDTETKISACNQIFEIAKQGNLTPTVTTQTAAATAAAKISEKANRIRKWEATLTPEQRALLQTQREAALVKARARKAENDRLRKEAENAKLMQMKENRRAGAARARATLADKRKAAAGAADYPLDDAGRVAPTDKDTLGFQRPTLEDLISMMKGSVK